MVMKKIVTDLKDLDAEGCYVEVAKSLAKSSRCMIVTGAGISCSAGIPDFRSKGGLYSQTHTNRNSVVRGQDLFDANLFRSPEATVFFYRFMGEFKDKLAKSKYTKTHSFIKRIHDSDKLLRCYTQNIDDLETGLTLNTDLEPNPRHAQVVQLHGTMSRLVCTRLPTQHSYDFSSEHIAGFKSGEAPDCPACVELQQKRAELGKRTNSSGTLRPDIVLYNEPHPMGEVIGNLQCHDLRKRPDFLLIMGTSLKIPGCKRLVKEAAKIVHSFKHGKVVFVNLSDVSTSEWDDVIDYHFQCETDAWVDKVESLFLKFFKPKASPRTLPRSASATLPRKPDLGDIEPLSSPLLSTSPTPSLNLGSDHNPFLDPDFSFSSEQSPSYHSLATPTRPSPVARSLLPRSSSALPSTSFGRSFDSAIIRPIEDLGFDSSSTKFSDYSTDEDPFLDAVDKRNVKTNPSVTAHIRKAKRKPVVIIDLATPAGLRKKSRGMAKAKQAELRSKLSINKSQSGKQLAPSKPIIRPSPLNTKLLMSPKPLTKVTLKKEIPIPATQHTKVKTVIPETPTQTTYSLRPRKQTKPEEKVIPKTAGKASSQRA